MNTAWKTHLTEREMKETEFARAYARDFAHGTDGHSRLMLIAKLAELLDAGLVPAIVAPSDPLKPITPRKPQSGA